MWSVSWVTPEASSAAGLCPIIPFPLHLSTPSRGVVWLALHCALYFTRPPQARQDAPLPERAHSDRARCGSTECRPHLRPSEFAPSRHPQSDGRVLRLLLSRRRGWDTTWQCTPLLSIFIA